MRYDRCPTCRGPMRFTTLRAECLVMDAPPGVAYFFDGDYMGQTVYHCRDHPEHDTPEPTLAKVLAWRAALPPAEWATHDPSPWIGGAA